MSPLRLLEPSILYISNTTENQGPLHAQALELATFANWMAGSVFLLILGGAVGSAQKDMVNYMLDIATPEHIPVQIPGTVPGRRSRDEQRRY